MTLRFAQNFVSDMDFSPRSQYSITDLTKSVTIANSIPFANEEPLHRPVPASPTDRVNKLADRFENCSLNENPCQTKNYFWLNTQTTNPLKRPIIPSSSNNTFNSYSLSQSLFEPSPTELWSRFRFEKNLWTEQSYSNYTNQRPMLFATKTSTSIPVKASHIKSLRLFYPILIFIIGFLLGYLLHHLPFLHAISLQCFNLLSDYLQILLEYIVSDTFIQSL